MSAPRYNIEGFLPVYSQSTRAYLRAAAGTSRSEPSCDVAVLAAIAALLEAVIIHMTAAAKARYGGGDVKTFTDSDFETFFADSSLYPFPLLPSDNVGGISSRNEADLQKAKTRSEQKAALASTEEKKSGSDLDD